VCQLPLFYFLKSVAECDRVWDWWEHNTCRRNAGCSLMSAGAVIDGVRDRAQPTRVP